MTRWTRQETALTPWVWHADIVRAHVANLRPTCHPSDCYICAQSVVLDDLQEDSKRTAK